MTINPEMTIKPSQSKGALSILIGIQCRIVTKESKDTKASVLIKISAACFDPWGFTLILGGSISAEHGIGVLKRDELPEVKDKVAIELMRSLKAMFDPLGIMNPGKVL